MVIILPFDTPSKKNSRVVNRKTGRSFPNKNYVEWHRKASYFISANYMTEQIKGPVSVSMHFVHGTFRRCDSDNKVSSILDLLVDLNILEDDSWTIVRNISVRNEYSKGEDSCTIEISSI